MTISYIPSRDPVADAFSAYGGVHWDQFLRDMTRETPAQKWLRQAAARLREMEKQEAAERSAE